MNISITTIQNLTVKGSKRVILYAISFGIPFLIFLGIRLVNLTEYSLWGGETFALIGAQMDWQAMLAYMVEDIVHPPFFYLLLRAWIAIGGDSLLWLKLLPLLFSIATIIPFLLLCLELNLRAGEIILAFFVLSVNGFLVHYAQELRSYIIFWFFSVCSLWLFLRFLKYNHKQDLWAFFIVNLLMVFTHYYGWLLIGTQFLTVLFIARHRLRLFLGSAAGWFALFVPWVFLLYNSILNKGGLGPNLGWIPKPGINTLLYFFSNLIGQLGTVWSIGISVSLIAILIGFWFAKAARHFSITRLLRYGGTSSDISHHEKMSLIGRSVISRYGIIIWLFALAIIPPAFIFLFSYLFPQALWVDRYFIFITVPFVLGLSLVAFRIKPDWLRNILIILFVAWSALSGIMDLVTNRVAWESPQLGSRVNWEAIAHTISQAETQTDGKVTIYTPPTVSKGLLTGDWAISTSLDYYFDKLGDTRFDFEYTRNLQSIHADSDKDYFWVAIFQLEADKKSSPKDYFIDKGYSVGDGIEFHQDQNRILLFPVSRDALLRQE
jgi:hypothetical protein